MYGHCTKLALRPRPRQGVQFWFFHVVVAWHCRAASNRCLLSITFVRLEMWRRLLPPDLIVLFIHLIYWMISLELECIFCGQWYTATLPLRKQFMIVFVA